MTAATHRLLLGAVAALLALPPTTMAAGDPLKADLVFSNLTGADQLCLRDGTGEYVCGDLAEGAAGARAIATGDVNGDGALDVVLGRGPDQLNRLCRGDGAGSFTCSDIGTIPATTSAIALGDLNGDGTLDAVFGTGAHQRSQVCLGDGTGKFACDEIDSVGGETHAVAIGDVNGDGAPDIVFAREGTPSQVCLGDGTGAFTCTAISPNAEDTFGIALGDVNHDGKLDAVLANVERMPDRANPQHNRVCLGDGAGHFDCHDVSTGSYRSTAVALGDLDRDGNLDAVFANTNQGSSQACFGDGHGDFDCRRIDPKDSSSSGLALVDLDGNRTLDIVFASAIVHRGEHNRACLGDGHGAFDCRDITADLFDSSGVATGKLTPPR